MQKTIAVLGPKGTFTEKVALERWKNARFLYAKHFEGVFELVENKKAEYGVIPTEDSVEGDVLLSLDLLRRYDVYIVEELRLEVIHCLLGKGKVEDLKIITSHPQALSHCRKYLDSNFPGLDIQPSLSTAHAAQRASLDPKIGAIADERVASLYGLNILRREIHDSGSNITRFFVIASSPSIPEGEAKTSIIIYPSEDRPGVLYEILREFAERRINLTRIVSRPSGRTLGEYVFFIDFEGSQKTRKVRSALSSVEKLSAVRAIRNLGSYSIGTRKKEERAPKLNPSQLIRKTFSFWENEEDRIYDSL
jgi:prephenate dehydratase